VTGPECPLIIYIPGLLPKPEPELHRDALLRCLLAGVRRIDTPIAEAIDASDGSFDIVSWTYDFYRSHRDFNIDRAAVEAVIAQPEAGARDIAEAGAWTRRLTRWIYRLGDRLPFLIPHLASERMEVHLRDLRRYTRNENGIAEHTRRMLKIPLKAAAERHRPILLIAHSMGSIIAYDALWELSHRQREHLRIDLFLTMGSPLGQRMMQKQIKGSTAAGAERYPTNVRHWRNLSAIGDLTAIDPSLRNDFAEMLDLGLLESFTDEEVLNYFRLDGELNVHSEYGYLANKKTALTIAKWWRGHVSGAPRVER
jgi:hypothetical protein